MLSFRQIVTTSPVTKMNPLWVSLQNHLTSHNICDAFIDTKNRAPQIIQLLNFLQTLTLSDDLFCAGVLLALRIYCINENRKDKALHLYQIISTKQKAFTLNTDCIGFAIFACGLKMSDWKKLIEVFFTMKCQGPNLLRHDDEMFKLISNVCHPNHTMAAFETLKSMMLSSGIIPYELKNSNSYSIQNLWKQSVYFFWLNSTLEDRYKMMKCIGSGTHASVFKALDYETHQFVAIKIVELGHVCHEIEMLKFLQAQNGFETSNIVKLKDSFTTDSLPIRRKCMVFDMFTTTLQSHFQVRLFPLHLIRNIARQLLQSLAFLSSKKVRVMFTDLKMNNICLEVCDDGNIEDCFAATCHHNSSLFVKVKLIDFGSAYKENSAINHDIQAMSYQSPEVAFGCPFTVAMDMWSLGCILTELYTSRPLFDGHNLVTHIKDMMTLLGEPPRHMIDSLKPEKLRNQLFEPYIDENTSEDYRNMTSLWGIPSENWQCKKAPTMVPLQSRLEMPSVRTSRSTLSNESTQEQGLFYDFISKMLVYQDRMSPLEALQHPFISNP
mmetsp:Transcript_53459/g.68603  ORF Transcript_53459/g.68603 Transcript_53459/m.68603 type:complete len:552 (-) Transcript_53459:144-1799(-)